MALLEWHLIKPAVDENLDCYVLDSNVSSRITLSIVYESYAHVNSQQNGVMFKISKCLKEHESTMHLDEISLLKYENRFKRLTAVEAQANYA